MANGNDTVTELIARSNRLGADPKNTNYAGGNTSAKGSEIDPVTGAPVDLLWVKGSGGDLGTLTADAPAVLRLIGCGRLCRRVSRRRARAVSCTAFDYCHGRSRAAPSIDTAMHLVDAPCRSALPSRLRHRAGHRGRRRGRSPSRSSATAWCRCPGGRRVPARPGRRRGRAEPASHRHHPRRSTASPHGEALGRSRGTVAGSHRDRREIHQLHGAAETFGAPLDGYNLADDDRRAKAAALPRLVPARPGLHRQAAGGRFTDDPGARLPGRHRASAAGRAGHQLP